MRDLHEDQIQVWQGEEGVWRGTGELGRSHTGPSDVQTDRGQEDEELMAPAGCKTDAARTDINNAMNGRLLALCEGNPHCTVIGWL